MLLLKDLSDLFVNLDRLSFITTGKFGTVWYQDHARKTSRRSKEVELH